MKADVSSILKAACRRKHANSKVVNVREDHFSMQDVDNFLKEKSKEEVVRKTQKAEVVSQQNKPQDTAQKRVFKAASLSDIFGFNPKASAEPAPEKEQRKVPTQWKSFYDKLIRLRTRLRGGALDTQAHEDETLSLDLISDPKEALKEIDAAIERIFDGTYGVCEITGKPILEQRLESIPYVRYSLEGQKQMEDVARARRLAQLANSSVRISSDEENEASKRPFYEAEDAQELNEEME